MKLSALSTLVKHTTISASLLISAAHASELFSAQSGLSLDASNAADSALAAIAAEATTSALSLAHVDTSAVSLDAKSVQFTLGKGLDLSARRTNSYLTEDGLLVWEGSLSFVDGKYVDDSKPQDQALNEVTLVKNGDMLTGNVRVDGQLFSIRPTHSGSHALYQVNALRQYADHPGTGAVKGPFSAALEAPGNALFGGIEGTAAAAATSTIRTLVMVTQSAKNNIADLNAFVALAISESNQGYTRSGVDIKLELAGLYVTNYSETGNYDTDLSRFSGTTDGYMDNVHTARNTQSADIAVLVSESGNYCGLGYLNASASTAFAEVKRSCATGYYSFGHEIGHLLSADHDPANAGVSPYSYGHGYQDPGRAFRTIMAYDCTGGSCNRINYWSNPYLTLNGKVLGTVNTHWNAKALNITRTKVAGFR
jgi:peptidyl-Asp metalloendopeptidase